MEEAVGLRTAWGPSVTRTTVVVVEVSVDSPRPSSTTMFKTAREASATRTTQEAVLEDLEDSHLGNSECLFRYKTARKAGANQNINSLQF